MNCDERDEKTIVNERAILAAKDGTAMEEFISEHRSFIRASASRSLGRFITEHDEEYMTDMEAFYEAVEKYEPDKGNFTSFAGVVIKRRLIDQHRKDARHSPEISVDGSTMDGELDEDTADSVAISLQKKVAAEQMTSPQEGIREEIEALSQTLEKYGFGFSGMQEASPKSKKTKAICEDVVCYMLKEDLVPEMRRQKHLPMNEICKTLKISVKKIERHRKYIMAVCEILYGEYPYLGEYLKGIKEKLGEES